MFTDPSILTVNAVAKSLIRINQDGYSSEYLLRTGTDEFRLLIRNTTYVDKKRAVSIDRHNVDFTHTVFPVAPATLSTVRHAYAVIENQQGDTIVDPVKVAAALFVFLSEANITKLMNLES